MYLLSISVSAASECARVYECVRACVQFTLCLWLNHKSAERCYSVIKNDNTLGWRARITCVQINTKYNFNGVRASGIAFKSARINGKRERDRKKEEGSK